MRHAAMTPAAAQATGERTVWAGRVLSGLVILFLLMDGAMKLTPLQVVIDTSSQLGWPTDLITLREPRVRALLPMKR